MAGLSQTYTTVTPTVPWQYVTKLASYYEIFAMASGTATQDEKIQCNIFLHVAGPEAQ